MKGPRFLRRRLLATSGVSVLLPMLPSLLHTRRAAAVECTSVQRFMVYMFPNGHHMPEHMPEGTGSGDAWQLPPMLASMQDLKSELTFISGLENQQRRREFGDHAIGCGAMLTARKPTANEQRTNMSVDQVIADAHAECGVRIPSLQYGTHNEGPTDVFGTYYTRSISWRGQAQANADGSMAYPLGDATPLGKEVDIIQAFERLFGGTDPEATAAEAEKRRALRQSVLDSVLAQADSVRVKLSPADQHKLDELFTGIRDLEQEIAAGGNLEANCRQPEAPVPAREFEQQLDQWHSLMTIAFQCDATRVITFMESDALSNRNLSFIPEVRVVGGEAGDHSVSHHSGQSELIEKFRAMVLWKMERIASFLRQLNETEDADGQTLLHNTLVMITSEIADGNRHNHDNIPVLLAGRLGGLVVPDRHVAFPTRTSTDMMKTFGDFYISLLDLYGVRVNDFGDDGKEAITWHE